MNFKPAHYTTKRLLLGWLAHFGMGAAIAFVCLLGQLGAGHAVGYPAAIYTFREGEQYRQRLKKGKPHVWPKVVVDVLATVAGAVAAVAAAALL